MVIYLLLVIVIALAIGLVVLATSGTQPEVDNDSRPSLGDQLLQADAELDALEAEVRRDMNDAAGQGWRNQFE